MDFKRAKVHYKANFPTNKTGVKPQSLLRCEVPNAG